MDPPASSAPALPPTLADLTAFLARRLPGADGPDADVPLRWRVPPGGADARPVRRLVLALDHRAPGLADAASSADALLLHRPFDLPPDPLGRGVPVLAVHRAFDAHLALGWNPALAEELGLTDLAELWRGARPNRPPERIGMVGAWAAAGSMAGPNPWRTVRARLTSVFGGLERIAADGIEGMGRVAVAGAMTPELIDAAADAGANVYVTGQFREVARAAAARRGVAVAAVGHRRSELWGLRRLADETRRAFPGLTATVLR